MWPQPAVAAYGTPVFCHRDQILRLVRGVDECARQSGCDPAGGRPAQVRSSVRLVASVAWPLATVVAKRCGMLTGVMERPHLSHVIGTTKIAPRGLRAATWPTLGRRPRSGP